MTATVCDCRPLQDFTGMNTILSALHGATQLAHANSHCLLGTDNEAILLGRTKLHAWKSALTFMVHTSLPCAITGGLGVSHDDSSSRKSPSML
jgi:hypothetical protein